MRPTLGNLGLCALWITGLWPLLLLAVHALTGPLAAVALQVRVEAALHTGALAAAAASLVLAFTYPPFPAGLRWLLVRTAARLRAEREPLLRAQSELRSFETGPRQVEAGRAALAAADPAAAVPHLLRAIELEPDQLAAHHLLGSAYLELGRPAEAREPLLRVVAAAPDHAFGDSMLLLGRAHMLCGEHRQAAEVLQRHSREHGGNRRSHYWLGSSLRQSGDRTAARAAFAVAAAPPPERPRLTAEEAFYRARARVALWGGRRGAPA